MQNYFAESANKFAHVIASSGSQAIIMASVIFGKVKDYGTERKDDLRMPADQW